MNWTQASSINAPIRTGLAVVSADPRLTLLHANDTFRALFCYGAACQEEGDSLLQVLPPGMPEAVQKMLGHGKAQEECYITCELSAGHKLAPSGAFPDADSPPLEDFCGTSCAYCALAYMHIACVRLREAAAGAFPVYQLVFTDLSDLIKMRRAADLERKKYGIIADITENIPFEYDFFSDTMYYAEKFQTVFGHPAVVRHFRERLSQSESLDTVSDLFREPLSQMQMPPGSPPECHARIRDGSYCWFSLCCTRIMGSDGNPLKAVGTIRNIDREKREQLRLLDKSRTDAMTGLRNKATTEEDIRTALCDVRPGSMGALMMLDVDNFKAINDSLGHMAGDAVIAQLARQLLRTFRSEDIVGRVGGDEFYIFMRNINGLEIVYQKAQELCNSVRQLFASHELDGDLSISLGVACADQPLPYRDLFRQADVALYRAKSNGKNRFEFYGDCAQATVCGKRGGDAGAPLVHCVARNSIMVDIIDTLFSAGDIRQGIEKALDFVGNVLKVSTILIYEKSLDLKTASITHEWVADDQWRIKESSQAIPVEDTHLPRPRVPGGIYYCSDLQALPPEEQNFRKDPAVTSLLQCDIVREDMVVGVISFETRGAKRIWTQQEIDALILLSKLISGHICQKQSAGLLRLSNDTTRDILNALPHIFVFVISDKSRELLYFNAGVLSHFPQARLGMACYELFMNRDRPCELCSCKAAFDGSTSSLQWHDTPFGSTVNLSMARILWENRQAATVLVISPHQANKKEKELQKRKDAALQRMQKRYNTIFRRTWDILTEVDLKKETYCRSFFTLASADFPEQGLYRDVLRLFLAHIHPEDRDALHEARSMAALRRAAASSVADSPCRYRFFTGVGYVWMESRLFILVEDGQSTAFLLSRNISREKRLEDERNQELQRFSLVLRNIYDGLYKCNVTKDCYELVYNSESKYELPSQGGSLQHLRETLIRDMVHPDDQERFATFLDLPTVRAAFAAGQEYLQGEFRLLRFDRQYLWTSLTLFPLSPGGASGEIRETSADDEEIYLIFSMDINERKQAEAIAQQNILLERQRLADERYRIIVEQTNTLVFEWCQDGKRRYISPELCQRFAGTYDERDIRRVWQEDCVIHPDDLPVFEAFWQDSCKLKNTEMTVRLRRQDDSFIWCKVVLSCLRDEQGQADRYIGTLNNVHEATCAAMALHYRAEYDMLTGVYNMQTFYARAAQLLQKYPECHYSIIRMDIDRFKIINDLYGLEEGDRLLKNIARLINERMSAHSVCGRISGDVFCMCVDFSEAQILAFVRQMTDNLAHYPLTSRLVPSFGICRVDNVETPINALCDWAHLALKTIKGNVLVCHAFYDEALRNHILEEKKIESQMHKAMELGQFVLYMQPKVDIATARIVGAEGLVRWMHPTEGLIEPDRFIPLFEKNGFIIRLDEYVWELACKQLRLWLDKGLPPVPMSVNVSRMHIHDTRLCEKLCALMEKYHLPPRMLELELTENVFLHNEDPLFAAIQTMQERGFSFALDDFGAGYSSLNMLKSLPIDVIKIDRGFLTEESATEKGKTVIRHTIAMAKALNMHVIAEGVENSEQVAFLLGAGCSLVQGFYYSPPVDIAAFETMTFGNPCPFPHLTTPQAAAPHAKAATPPIAQALGAHGGMKDYPAAAQCGRWE